ncbi:MAG: NDP-sugar synthase [Elusimicrobiota bacterium]|nr:NDP-sugar synthase [Elusimicrobiota bacterium]
MKAIILLGGFGTRLRPFSCHTPKPLLPILNRPGLEYQLELIRRYGIKEVVFCLNYLSKKFLNYFGSGKKFGLKIHYCVEKIPLGTGGAIKNAQKFFDNNPAIIFNGDILTDINLGEIAKLHINKKAVLTIALVRVKDPTVYGLVETDKNCRILRFLEKPSWDEVTCNTINAGIYVFQPELLQYIPEGINYSLERGLFPLLLEKKKPVYGFISPSYWIDIGTIEKYLQVHFDILKGELKVCISGRKIKKNFFVEKNVIIDSTAVVDGKVVIGKNTLIGSYVQLNGFVSIGRNCKISKGAQITDSVILDNTIIGEGAKLEKCIVGKNCKIEPHTVVDKDSAIGDNTHITRFSRL